MKIGDSRVKGGLSKSKVARQPLDLPVAVANRFQASSAVLLPVRGDLGGARIHRGPALRGLGQRTARSRRECRFLSRGTWFQTGLGRTCRHFGESRGGSSRYRRYGAHSLVPARGMAAPPHFILIKGGGRPKASLLAHPG